MIFCACNVPVFPVFTEFPVFVEGAAGFTVDSSFLGGFGAGVSLMPCTVRVTGIVVPAGASGWLKVKVFVPSLETVKLYTPIHPVDNLENYVNESKRHHY